ncbi:MAG: peptide chain release factor 1 [Candidatus Aureabacteria bacterium]|nr:peptide chain release factor 1 [Candidatus Auribacterota bacterium]
MLRERMDALKARLSEIEGQISDPAVIGQQSKYRRLAQEHAGITEVLASYREYERVAEELVGNERLLREEKTDGEFRALVEQELQSLTEQKKRLEDEVMRYLLPRDKDDDRNTIVEIRAGTGGDEAALFVADLFRMYSHYAEKRGWKVETMDSHPTGIGGFKEIIFSVEGKDVYRNMKYESGVHRVQRVPATEASGRIHTSAATVAVLSEAEDVEVKIDPKDIRVDVYRSSGHGGQSVNTTDSAVRITHLATGLMVTCQDEKSQHKNKVKALRVLRARLKERMEEEQAEKVSSLRRSQVSTGDRSAKIRTYNFPQNRVTDHRIGLTVYNLESVIEGNLDEFTAALMAKDHEEKLKQC